MNPSSCNECHPKQLEEWSGSMHAYAGEDPVFLAMNRRGQRETGGKLGVFCVKCHAPVAVREGLTSDGLDLAALPAYARGVTCWFCHQVDEVTGDHDAALSLADDESMRGGIVDPVDSEAHDPLYSELHDGGRIGSSRLCGSCHDIVTPAGVHLERTFAEWRGSLFSRDTAEERQTCVDCHMPSRSGQAAQIEGTPLRQVHDHSMPGVDVALTDSPQVETQKAAVLELLASTVLPKLCVKVGPSGWTVEVTLENVAAGHAFPSGAAQDRRAWLELEGTFGGQTVFSLGETADDRAFDEARGVWWLGETMRSDSGEQVHMFWEASRTEGELLPAPTTRSVLDPAYVETHVTRAFSLPDVVDEVRVKMRIRPIDFEVIDSLIESGDLDPAVRLRMPTFELARSELVWRARDGETCVPADL
ncbi:MAG: hypothetical protein HY791_02025 [Deltaproteobacteria bacterium]|nr:hypothetical protein [Deltaproteobacteria bacterium]